MPTSLDSLISYPSLLLSDTAITLVTKLLCWDSVPVPVTQNDVSDITAKGATAVAVSVYQTRLRVAASISGSVALRGP